jgi:hypothetical protein
MTVAQAGLRPVGGEPCPAGGVLTLRRRFADGSSNVETVT